jgi:predicted enzyme related to lactoylglutathione lyase
MPLHCKTAFVALAALKFDELTQFYEQLLQRSPAPLIANTYAEFQLPDLRLGIFQPKPTYESEFSGQSSSISLCLEVEHLEAAIDHLTAIGYPPAGEIITASHGREIYAYDPAGNRLILHESGWEFG